MAAHPGWREPPMALLTALPTSFPSGTSCVAVEGGNTTMANWCIDNCLSGTITDTVYRECLQLCRCNTWNRQVADWILGAVGALSLLACLLVAVLDLRGAPSSRCHSQSACLKWSNYCNLLYSLYYVGYALGDGVAPMQEPRQGTCDGAWRGLIGMASCDTHGAHPLCFLNCCVFAVPWLELFGYGSLLWNMFWTIDLARFTLWPLAPEKAMGLPIMVLYHLLTWVTAIAIAFQWDFSRLDTAVCRQAQIVMVPCVLRRGSIHEALPWIHLLGFLCVGVATIFTAQRYVASSLTRGRNTAREALYASVRRYLRQQWLHMATLLVCWGFILADSCRSCQEDWLSFVTAGGYAGLGLLLGTNRLLSAARDLCSMRTAADAVALQAMGRPATYDSEACEPASALFASPEDSPTRQASMGQPDDIVSLSSSQLGGASSQRQRRCSNPENYRLVDLDALLEHLLEYLGEEKAQAQLQRELFKQDPERHLTWLRDVAALDDNPNIQADWCISSHGAADEVFTVVAPRTFSYLKHLWSVDAGRLHEELSLTDSGSVRTAAKSGCMLLTAPDGGCFVLKTVSEVEIRQLRQILPAYRQHMEDYPGSFICHVFGAFTLRNQLGSRLHAVLMDCLSGPPEDIHCGSRLCFFHKHSEPRQDPDEDRGSASSQLFDIKSEFQDGGLVRRFPVGLALFEGAAVVAGTGWRESLAADYGFLASLGVVDYSLLLVIWRLPESSRWKGSCSRTCPAGHCHRGSAAYYDASCQGSDERPAGSPAHGGGNYLVRMGIIDFLVPFGRAKWTESALKRTLLHPRHASERVTITDPATYAERQRAFVHGKLFPPVPAGEGGSV